MLISIIIPAYNEGLRLIRTLDSYLTFFKNADVEFIIVPNNCSDNTAEIASQYAQRFPEKIKVREIKGYSGKGGAVVEGFRISRGDIVGFVDADGSTSADEYGRMLASLDQHDGVILSRWKKGSRIVNGNPIREIISIGFIFWVKVLFWMPITDTQCGAKAFKRRPLFSVIDRLKIHDMAFDVELLWRFHTFQYSVKEVPSTWIDNSSDSAAMSSPLRLIKNAWAMFSSILKLRFDKKYA